MANNSLLCISQLSSTPKNFFKKKDIGQYFLSFPVYPTSIPITQSKTSIASSISNLGLNIAIIFLGLNYSFILLKAYYYLGPQIQLISFFVRLVNRVAIPKKSLIRLQQKLQNLINSCISLTLISTFYSQTALYFTRSIKILQRLITNLRNMTSSLQNLHFFSLIRSPFSISLLRTQVTSLTYLARSYNLVKISILLRYVSIV